MHRGAGRGGSIGRVDAEAAPTSHAATDLEALLPGQIAGVTLVKYSASAASDEASGLEDVATRLGRPLESVLVAFAADTTGVLDLTLAVIRIEGVPATEVLAAVVADDTESFAESSSVTLAGQTVSRFSQADSTDRAYALAARDLLFFAFDDSGGNEPAVEEAVCRFAQRAPGG